jgi:hypothetical protein
MLDFVSASADFFSGSFLPRSLFFFFKRLNGFNRLNRLTGGGL